LQGLTSLTRAAGPRLRWGIEGSVADASLIPAIVDALEQQLDIGRERRVCAEVAHVRDDSPGPVARLYNARPLPEDVPMAATSRTLIQPNAQSQYEVTVEDLPLSCPMPEMYLWNSHPRVYLPIEQTGWAKCPYCGAEYTLKRGAGEQGGSASE
jgi:uncharacterized Zn-finger protein